MQGITWRVEGEVGILTVARAEVLNALDSATLEQMLAALEAAKEVSAVILTGQGQKAFIAGADVKAMQQMSLEQIEEYCALGKKVVQALRTSPFITMAAINGYALGAGLEMALACNWSVASVEAKLGFPEVKLGLIPGFGGTYLLRQLVGERQACELVMSGKVITAQEAMGLGLINAISSSGQLLEQCMQKAQQLLANPLLAVLNARKAIQQALPIRDDCEQKLFCECFCSSASRQLQQQFCQR